LFSINKALKNGFKLSNYGVSIRLEKGPVSLCFDRIALTANDFVTGIKMSSVQQEINYTEMVNATINKSFDINQIHKVSGQCRFET
jgi:hypothetical protein